MCALAVSRELDRGERHRDRRAAAGHRIAEHDAALRHDVEIERVGREARIALGAEALHLMPAFAKIEGLLGDHPAAGDIPLCTSLGLRPGSEYPRRRRLVGAFQPDRAMLRGTAHHRLCYRASVI